MLLDSRRSRACRRWYSRNTPWTRVRSCLAADSHWATEQLGLEHGKFSKWKMINSSSRWRGSWTEPVKLIIINFLNKVRWLNLHKIVKQIINQLRRSISYAPTSSRSFDLGKYPKLRIRSRFYGLGMGRKIDTSIWHSFAPYNKKTFEFVSEFYIHHLRRYRTSLIFYILC
jgi:hypothetical protein